MAGGTGLYPQRMSDLSQAGFTDLESASFDMTQPYSHEAWIGRIKASAGIRASLDEAATELFVERLAAVLKADLPDEPVLVPHRVW